MSTIYECRGKHFKVYNSTLRQVLEHPSDTEEVDLEFRLDDQYLVIAVTGFIETSMRVPGQKNRIDIYVLQDQFYPLLAILRERLDKTAAQHAPQRAWRYGMPMPRPGRQTVPNLRKLAELAGVGAVAPFGRQLAIVRGATAVIDSEVPGEQQTKWQREGASRQIHIGVFGGRRSTTQTNTEQPEVRVYIPITEIKYNLVESVTEHWVEA